MRPVLTDASALPKRKGRPAVYGGAAGRQSERHDASCSLRRQESGARGAVAAVSGRFPIPAGFKSYWMQAELHPWPPGAADPITFFRNLTTQSTLEIS